MIHGPHFVRVGIAVAAAGLAMEALLEPTVAAFLPYTAGNPSMLYIHIAILAAIATGALFGIFTFIIGIAAAAYFGGIAVLNGLTVMSALCIGLALCSSSLVMADHYVSGYQSRILGRMFGRH